MLSLLTALLCATAIVAAPAAEINVERDLAARGDHNKGHHGGHGGNPTPTVSFGPPPSSFPSSLPAVPYTSTSVWLPPRPSTYPVHYGDFESTPVWIFYPDGNPLYSMCVEAQGCGKGKKGGSGKVSIANCNSSPSQQWSYGVQSGPQIKLAGTDKCLDAGRNPSPGSKLRVSRCDGSSGQTWFVANTGLWILNDRDSNYLCADITGGSRAEGTPLQLWPCAQGNYNQQFYPGFCYSNSCIM